MFGRLCCRRGPKRLCMVGGTLLFLAISYLTLLQFHVTSRKHIGPSQFFKTRLPPKRHTRTENGTWVTQSGQACVHPQLELWHPSLKHFFQDVPPLECAEEEDWATIEAGKFKLNQNAVSKHGDIICNVVPITFLDDNYVEEGTRRRVKDGDRVPNDFLEVKCFGQRTQRTYINIHANIAYDAKLQHRFKNSKQYQKGLDLNVLMFGFDSVSRMTWMRNLPKSYEYFTKVLGGVVLEGYNILGDGTPQALLPILTGQTEMELPEARRSRNGAKPVDGHPWIWKDLKQLGYVTQWGEDGASFGTFNYRMLGFREQPVDHYLRTFYLRAERMYKLHKPFCLGSKPRHIIMFNWIKEFFRMYPTQPKFSFLFHSEFTHDGHSMVRVVDADLVNFLKYMNENGYLNKTLLILMSDHGARFQDVRQTVQGKHEERLPFFGLRLPPSFERDYPEQANNLRINAHRLTNPFDIHATFKDIVKFSGAKKTDESSRGISLFQEIPEGRTCQDAEIESHWCACLSWKDVPINDAKVEAAAESVVQKINELTAPQRQNCEQVSVGRIVNSVVYEANNNVLKFKQSKDTDGRIADLSDHMAAAEVLYQVTIETKPNKGLFEATVTHKLSDGAYLVNERQISRINKYGSDPSCVMKAFPHLRPYCYCKQEH